MKTLRTRRAGGQGKVVKRGRPRKPRVVSEEQIAAEILAANGDGVADATFEVTEMKPRKILIPRPTMEWVEAKLVGIAPGLVLNPFDEKAEQELLDSMGPRKARLKRPDKDPKKEYAERLERVRVPGIKDAHWIDVLAFKSAMVRGAKMLDKLSMTDFRSAVFVEPDSIIGLTPVAHIIGKPVRFSKHVMLKGGRPDYRTRVLIPEWTYTLRFTVNTTVLSIDQALTCLVNAGIGTGVGDWRVERSGISGRWDVTECTATPLAEVE
jgi:hypothetical protein